MIEVLNLTKQFGSVAAVDDLSFTVQPGTVTGFLGPNGAGKTTTMRAIAGLDRPTSGSATINSRPLAESKFPMRELGVLLDARAFHPGRSAIAHLGALAATNGISDRRVAEVIGMTGLESVAKRRAGTFSLGMAQRLGIAAALLGDPRTIIMDEPINGLDPDGVVWVRNLLRYLASDGRTVFLSSHLMSEMAETADHLVVIGKGRLLADASTASVIARAGQPSVVVRTTQPTELIDVLASATVKVAPGGDGELIVTGLEAPAVAAAASRAGIRLNELRTSALSLEDAYFALTQESVQYRAGVETN